MKHPYHDNLDEVLAKIWLIGRSYAAAIERRPKSKSKTVKDTRLGDDFYVNHVGPSMLAARVDDWIEPLRSMKKPCSTNVDEILAAHKQLTNLFQQITGIEKRSLASKYLHFHLPQLFYLYDSRAADAIRSYEPRTKLTRIPNHFDRVYAPFFLRCLQLTERIQNHYGFWMSPRAIDNLLLGLY